MSSRWPLSTRLGADYLPKLPTLRGEASVKGKNLTVNDQFTFTKITDLLGVSTGGAFCVDNLDVQLSAKDSKIDLWPSQVSVGKYGAVAEGFIAMHQETLDLIVEGKAAKGDVLACARVAGVMAAKQTSSLIPMCHPLNITKAKVECAPVQAGEREDGRVGIHITTTCGVTGKTGIEMEALTAASVACLTVYDMCKAVDRGMEITEVRLLKKDGGKTGLWLRD